MSFTPLSVPAPECGNNADARSVVLRVMNDNPVTPALLDELAALFETHKTVQRHSLVGYSVRMSELGDGTRVRIVSNSGLHTIMVWPAGGHVRELLPHGFLVLTSWSDPAIYGKANGTWRVLTHLVPQADQPIVADSYIVRTRGSDAPLLIPLVRQRKYLWGNKRQKAHDFGESLVAIAESLEVDGKIPPEVHTMVDNKIFDTDGATVLYTMADTAPILLDAEQLHYLPGETDARSTVAVLQSWRRAVLSATFEIEQYRLCNERLQRTAVDTYTQIERNVTDLVVQPTGNSAVLLSTSSAATLDGEEPAASDLKYIFLSISASTGYGGGRSIFWGASYPVIAGSVASTDSSATFDKSHQASGDGSVISKMIALPKEQGADYVAWHSQLNYPDTTYWRAGIIRKNASYAGRPVAPTASWQTEYKQIQRIDAQHHRDCAPKVWLDIPWAPDGQYMLFEGSGHGDVLGFFKQDLRRETADGGGVGFADDTSFIIASIGGPPFGNFPQDAPIAQGASVSSVFNALAAPHNPSLFSIDIVEFNQVQPLGGTLEYAYKSRHIIDFDARSQFYAAIRVEVACTGAVWSEDGSASTRGILKEDSLPSYQVDIYLEWCWNGMVSDTLLATGTCTRPGFEFEQLQHINMYTWPIDTAGTTYWMPPRLAPPGDAAAQLTEVMGQQGTNLFFAGADHLADESDASTKGIEFSVTVDGVMSSARKWVPGMLYARTFKIGDFSEALWLIRATHCDAPQGNDTLSELPAWFYMPDLGNTIATQVFHIELRDGQLVQWSDDLEPREGEDIPAPEGRNSISIYRV